jgi:2-hydroxy-4-carboxymuconate semialdehyde hemiacetal dehydrogenase
MKVALAGAGAFGEKHLDALKLIDGVEVVSLVGRTLEKTKAIADKYGVQHVTENLVETLERADVDAVLLCTPTQMHAAQAIACMDAGKHVMVEIPLADSWADAQAVLRKHKETGLVCMGPTRRFNPASMGLSASRKTKSPFSRWMCRHTFPPHQYQRQRRGAQLD